MTWVKICGMTNVEDALVAADAGVDAVGFVFYEKSPRNLSVEAAREISAKLPEKVEKIGVFWGARPEEWVPAARTAKLTGVQHYMPLEPDLKSHQSAIAKAELQYLRKFVVSFPMNLFLEAEAPLDEIGADLKHFRDDVPNPESAKGIFDTFLLDSGGVRSPGGSGQTFNWHRTVTMVEQMKSNNLKAIVAGGLTPENVTEAIETLHPYGVDVVSGVEASPGKKDPAKVRAFVKAVRECDRKVS